MKNKTMKKAIALILATLMLALATPFAMINVAAEEATPTQIEILFLSTFGKHIKADGTGTQSLNFYASYPAAAAFDGDIASDAQILNNDSVGNLQYEMCYFDENGNMVNGTNASGKSYYLALTLMVMDLPDRYKQVILLHFFQGLTMQETADALGASQSTVHRRLKKAEELLKGSLTGGVTNEG